METALEIYDWGRTNYPEAVRKQIARVETLKSSSLPQDCLVFTEHEASFTIGSKIGAEKHLLWDSQTLESEGISVYKSNRGGDITYHGPGQMVIYPILKLKDRDLNSYLRKLESVVINLLRYFDIKAGTRPGKTGIWIENRKICAIGVAVKSWISYHGLALNIDPKLRHFKGIIPCGITDGTVTSMAQELKDVPEKKYIKERFIVEFKSIFYDI